ncbi:hypothetical protein [Pseudonocardia sp. 73-21]|uniref:hypothetical protein n=1 Tax=Pseudonocardia sp. 73-21 TaxID=1895809 RepID=UPI000963AC87|nr:hypothetical protein [Pseudonocardia sp. 73-21]OJY50125.1 MAG: hypothetical protein BGP03_25000 [Pseudonocardia sp. 73-21]
MPALRRASRARPGAGHLHIPPLRHAPRLADLTDDEAAVAHFHQRVFVRTEGTPRDVPWHVGDDRRGRAR